ncbi:hypothetical protein C4588_01050 [Candidatus Parcubacteria bacterium]|nr:MAG: hypothetical protein C4588_01050 [Candidatus Parcubacteria bacterium]
MPPKPIIWVDRPKPKRFDGQYLTVERIEQKLDGYRVTIVQKHKNRLPAVYGRTVRQDLNLSSSLSSCGWYYYLISSMPPHSILDGELLHPKGFNFIKTALKERSSNLQFFAFACPYWDGKDMRFRWFQPSIAIDFVPDVSEQFPADASSIIEECKKRDWEGVILKCKPYEDWWKIKVTHTIDLQILDVNPGDGRLYGTVGSVWTKFGNVSGFTDDERQEIRIGRWMEVEFQGMVKERMRHARFVRWRNDLDDASNTTKNNPI